MIYLCILWYLLISSIVFSSGDFTHKDWFFGRKSIVTHANFQPVPDIYATRPGILLHPYTLAAFIDMAEAAQADGIPLKVVSGYRSFTHQSYIWESIWTGKRLTDGMNIGTLDPNPKIKALLKYHAMPGTSRHHWGTEVDLNYLTPKYFEHGIGLKVYQWLEKNAHLYGFCQVYDATDGRTWYHEENWHWSYMPLSIPIYAHYINIVKSSDINGFLGSDHAKDMNVISQYVDGISPDCIASFSPPQKLVDLKTLLVQKDI